jgi:hypothetical protein
MHEPAEFERGGSAYAPGLLARLHEIRSLAASLLDDPVFASKLAAASARISALEIFELRSRATARLSAIDRTS